MNNTSLILLIAGLIVLAVILLILWRTKRDSWESYSIKLLKKVEDSNISLLSLQWTFLPATGTATATYPLGSAGNIKLTVGGGDETEITSFTATLRFYFLPIFYESNGKNLSSSNSEKDIAFSDETLTDQGDAFTINYVFEANPESDKPTPAIFSIIDPHIKNADKKGHRYGPSTGPITEVVTVKTGSVKARLMRNGIQVGDTRTILINSSLSWRTFSSTDAQSYKVEILPPNNSIDNVYKMCGMWNCAYDANPPTTFPI